MKRLLLTPSFKRFKKSAFLSSLNQNNCPVYDAEEIKNKNNKKLLESYTHKKKDDSLAQVKKQDTPHHPAFLKILALHIVFVSHKNLLLVELFVSN